MGKLRHRQVKCLIWNSSSKRLCLRTKNHYGWLWEGGLLGMGMEQGERSPGRWTLQWGPDPCSCLPSIWHLIHLLPGSVAWADPFPAGKGVALSKPPIQVLQGKEQP